MEIGHYRDALHTYLVLPEPEEVQTGGYQYRMLAANKIQGLLPCCLRAVNGEKKLCYDITARQKFSVFHADRKLGVSDLQRLAADITALRRELSLYLLDPEHLIMTQEFVYYDLTEGHYLFLYYPDAGGRDMRDLFTSAADLVREDDRDAAALAYRLAACAEDPDLLLHRLETETTDQGGQDEETDPEPVPTDDYFRQEESGAGEGFYEEPVSVRQKQDLYEEGRGPKRQDRTGRSRDPVPGLSVAAALLLLGCVASAAYPMFFRVTERGLLLCRCLAVFCLVLSAAAGILILLRSHRRKKAQTSDKGEDLRLFREEMRREQIRAERMQAEEKAREEETGTVFLGFEGTRASGLYSEDPRMPNIDLRRLPLTLGRNEQFADRAIEDPSISRLHVRFTREAEGGLMMRDLNSTNGTWINGRLLEPEESVPVHKGDEVRFGEAIYECR